VNGVAGLFLALYLGIVAYQGNADTLFSYVKQEKGFLLWLVCLVLLYALHKSAKDNAGKGTIKLINAVFILIFAAMILNGGGNIFTSAAKFITEFNTNPKKG
jgi:hypothetical protein